MIRPKKEELSLESLQVLEKIYTQTKNLPDSPEKDAKLRDYGEKMQKLLTEFDLPAQAIAPDAPLMEALQWIPGVSYLPGLERTAAGEIALAAAGKSKGAGQRILNAVIPDMPFASKESPMGQPALSVGEYRDLLGPRTDWEKEKLFPENSYFNPTRGGSLEVLAGMLLDPSLLVKGPKPTVPGGNTSKEVAASIAKNVEEKAAPLTAKEALLGGLKSLADPSNAFAQLNLRSRFSQADKATKAAGKERFSDVFQRLNVPGTTREGVAEGVQKVASQEAERVNDLISNLDREVGTTTHTLPAQPTMEDLTAPFGSQEFRYKVEHAPTNVPYSMAENEAKSMLDKEALANAERAAQYEARNKETGMVLGKNPPKLEMKLQKEIGFVPNGPEEIKLGHQKNAGDYTTEVKKLSQPQVKYFARLPDGTRVEVPASDPHVLKGLAEKEIIPGTRDVEFQVPKEPEFTPSTMEQPSKAVISERPVIAPSEERTDITMPPPSRPSQYFGDDIKYNLRDLGFKASQYGGLAANAGYFSQPSMFDVQRKAANLASNQAEASVWNMLRDRARNLQLDYLDKLAEAKVAPPDVGGKAKAALSSQSSLYEGAPYISGKEFHGKYSTPTSRTSNALRESFNAAPGVRIFGNFIPSGTGDTAKMLAYRAFSPQAVRKVLQPWARSYINERASDSSRFEPSPWEFLKSYNPPEE